MGNSNSSPYFSSKAVQAFLSAPIQSLFAWFIPTYEDTQHIKIFPTENRSAKHLSHQKQVCHTKKPWLLHSLTSCGAAKACIGSGKKTSTNHPRIQLKIVRELEVNIGPAYAGRMVISGSMSDVCAELDRLTQHQ